MPWQEFLNALEKSSFMSPKDKRLIAQMRELVQKKADELQIEPALLASRKQLEALIGSLENDQAIPERLQGWRQTVITENLLNLAAKENNR